MWSYSLIRPNKLFHEGSTKEGSQYGALTLSTQKNLRQYSRASTKSIVLFSEYRLAYLTSHPPFSLPTLHNLNYIIALGHLEGSLIYLFGPMRVLSEPGSSLISGAFVLRGQDYKPVVEVASDWDPYEYKKARYRWQ